MVSISIIIPTRNERRNIERLLTSIAADPHPPREVIVVDNHSTDNTCKIARETWNEKKGGYKFSQRTQARQSAWLVSGKRKRSAKSNRSEQENFVPDLPQLTILTKGPERSFQKNAGAHQAKGSHLLFLDADMEIKPGLLSELASLAAKKLQAAVIPEHPIGSDFWSKAIALERTCYQGNEPLEAPRFIEKRVFQALGGYDPNLIAGEDWALGQRLRARGIRISRTHNRLLHHEAPGFSPSLRRKWYYLRHIHRYAGKYPHLFREQESVQHRLAIFWRKKTLLAKHPFHTVAFLMLKAIVYSRWMLEKNERTKDIHPQTGGSHSSGSRTQKN